MYSPLAAFPSMEILIYIICESFIVFNQLPLALVRIGQVT